MFIALEGIDGSGKETQAKLLNRWVKDKRLDTFLTREPTTGPIGKLLREFLKTGGLDARTEALLFAADRNEHVKEINKKLALGKVVITERYFYSSLAYQSASGVDITWLTELNNFAPKPDIVFLLDIDPEVSLPRILTENPLRGRLRAREHFERKEFLNKVRELYLALAKENKNFVVVDASLGIRKVQTAIRKRVGRLLSEGTDEEIKTEKELGEYL